MPLLDAEPLHAVELEKRMQTFQTKESMKRKATRIKRLRVNEVQLVAEMQSKIDFYERFLAEVATMCLSRNVHLILEGRYSSWETGAIYKFVKKKIEEENEQSNGEGGL